jgi:hypothetical protein
MWEEGSIVHRTVAAITSASTQPAATRDKEGEHGKVVMD